MRRLFSSLPFLCFLWLLFSDTPFVVAAAAAAVLGDNTPRHMQREEPYDDYNYQCNEGCTLRKNDTAVCGEDGFTYQNRCIAYCQGIPIASSTGPCRVDIHGNFSSYKDQDDNNNIINNNNNDDDDRSNDTASFVSVAILNQFQTEGFQFVGKRTLLPNRPITPTTLSFPAVTTTSSSSSSSKKQKQKSQSSSSNEKVWTVTRVTSDGNEYRSKVDSTTKLLFYNDKKKKHMSHEKHHHHHHGTVVTTQKEGADGLTNILNNSNDDDNNNNNTTDYDTNKDQLHHHHRRRHFLRKQRGLKVIGRDQRTIIEYAYDKFPAKLVGEMDYINQGEGGCTGTIIGDDHVLTAAHCVTTKGGTEWLYLAGFSPARYNSGGSSTAEPFGRWYVQYKTILDAYTHCGTQQGCSAYDVAILHLERKNGLSISQVVGKATCMEPAWSTLPDTAIRGYPGDRPPGSIWISNDCGFRSPVSKRQKRNHRRLPAIIRHYCDTAPGDSGAALMTKSGQILGIHIAADAVANCNYAVLFGQQQQVLEFVRLYS